MFNPFLQLRKGATRRIRSWRLWLKLFQASPGEEPRLRRPLRFRLPGCKPWLETLEDRLAPATVQFGLAKESLLETSGTFTIPVTISAASTSATSVPFTLGGSAASGTDYSGVTASPVVIPAGQLAVNIAGALLTPNDGVKTLTFTLGPPTGAVLGSSTVNTLTINEPAANTTTLSISNSSMVAPAPGGTVNMNFTVTRTGDLTSQITIGYTTASGTAQPTTNFTPTTGTTTFASGSATALISIPIFGNGVSNNPNLTFSVQLTGILSVVGPPVTLTAQAAFATGSAPISVAVGDVNGDGLPDLVVANSSSNTVSILLNTTAPGASTASFAVQQTFAVGSDPASVAVADVNGDGKPDLIVTNEDANTVSVLLNTTTPGASTASFAAQQTFATGTQPVSVTLGDVNGDGKPDLIVANELSATTSVLLNTTTPGATTASFAAQQTFATGIDPLSVAVGDVNGDGLPDVIVANGGDNTVSVLLNKTTPGASTAAFAAQQTFATGSRPVSVALGDVNGDGLPDLIVANQADATVSVLLNTTTPGASTASFAAQQTFATGIDPVSVALGDVNGDGLPDVIVANENDNTVSVLLNATTPGASTPFFAAQQTFAAGTQPVAVALGDVNDDGLPDLILPSVSNNTVSVLLNTTVLGSADLAPDFPQTTFAASSEPFSVAVGDLNGDGKPDLVVASVQKVGDGFASVLLNTTSLGSTTPSFAAPQTFAVGANPLFVTLGDVNGDGKLDIVVANNNDNTVSVLMNTTTPGASTISFATQQTFATGSAPSAVAVADVNGDGKPDLIVSNFNSASASVLLNTTTPGSTTASFAAQQTFAVSSFPDALTVGDVNGDGKPDVITSTGGDNTVSVLLNTTPAGATKVSFAAQQTFAAGLGTGYVVVGDVNGDGKPDIVTTNYQDDTVSVLLNTTTPGSTTASFAAQQTFATGPDPYSLALGDVNGDGKPDLIVVNSGKAGGSGGNSVLVLLNTTAPGATIPSFATQQTFAAGAIPEFVAVGDLNGDGRPDLIIANYGDNTVSVLMNTPVTILGDTATGTITQPTAPIVSNPTDASITSTTATLGGDVASDGGAAITARGVVYSLTAVNANPQVGGAGVTNLTAAGTTGLFTVSVSGLTPGATYSFKAYAANSVGATYTSPVSTFTTVAPYELLNGNVYRITTGGTVLIDSGAVSIGLSGTNLVELKDGGQLYLYNGSIFQLLDMGVAAFQADGNGNVAILESDGALRMYPVGGPLTLKPVVNNVQSIAVTAGGTVYFLSDLGVLQQYLGGTISPVETGVQSFQLDAGGNLYELLTGGSLIENENATSPLETGVTSFRVSSNGVVADLQTGGALQQSGATVASGVSSFAVAADGTLYYLTSSGLMKQGSGTPVDAGVTSFALGSDGTLYELQGTTLFQRNGATRVQLDSGVKSIAAAYNTLYDLESGGELWQHTRLGWSLLDNGATAVSLASNGVSLNVTDGGGQRTITGIVTGLTASNNTAIYDLFGSGALWQDASGVWTQLDSAVTSIALSANNLLLDLEANGRLYGGNSR